MGRVGIEIWSRDGSGDVGGLAAYQRALAAGLEARGRFDVRCHGASAAVSRSCEDGSWCVWEGGMAEWLRRTFRPAASLASRTFAHGILEGWIVQAGRTRIAAASPDLRALHFVGTGWDLVGFAVGDRARRGKAIFTVWPATHPGNWGDDRIDIRLYRQADAVLCQSESERRHLGSLGVPDAKLVVTGLPPMCRTDGDADRFRSRHGLGHQPAAFFIGRRDAGKGYPALLQAWPRVLKRVPDAVVILAGPGGEAYADLRAALPTKSVIDLGVPDEGEKADALARCDLLCLPSAHESFGIVYVEAWSYGKAVICGTAPASRELVPDSVAGVHASQEVEELTAALVRLLGNRAEAESLGSAGKRLQEERYTVERMVDDHLRVWDVQLGRRP